MSAWLPLTAAGNRRLEDVLAAPNGLGMQHISSHQTAPPILTL
jgi:hypothetical protein